MGYKYIRDISTEYPFYQRMAGLLKGKKSSRSIGGKEVYEVECPCCNKRRSYMFMGEKRDTFIFKCFIPQCSITSMPLHDLIKRYGGESMFNEWRKASWTTTYEENWFPIQNKVAYKDRAPRKKKTFKDKQELKSVALQIKMNSHIEN